MPTATIDGQEIYYRDSAEERTPDGSAPSEPFEAPAVLFCHGFLMDHSMWEPQVEALAPDFRCVRWDERGFGRTPAEEPFTYWDLADDAVGLLDHLGIERAVLVGMSQGGYLSLRAALAHPERVSGLVLEDTRADRDDPETMEMLRGMLEGWIARGPSDELMDQLAGMILGDAEGLRERWIRIWKEKPPSELELPARCLLERDDVPDRLDEIDGLALVVHGEDDVAIPVDVGEELHRRLPGSGGIVRVSGAMHAPNLTHPEIVNPALRRFLEGVGEGPGR
jgi:pimeloyl-ACP methyl ester carboxylesterase